MKRVATLVAAVLAGAFMAVAPVQADEGHMADKKANPYSTVPYIGWP